MVKCTFCGVDESYHKGVHFIKNDGSVNYLCSSKCRRNSVILGRDKRRVMWTEAYREELHKARKAEKYKEEAEVKKAEAKVARVEAEKKEKSKSSKKKTAAK